VLNAMLNATITYWLWNDHTVRDVGQQNLLFRSLSFCHK